MTAQNSVPLRKGIILAGGSGTRLYPVTHSVSKQLMPVYDKPMIYYPLTTLMLAGIRTIQIITTPRDSTQFSALLGTGEQWGLDIHYAVQPEPKGIAQSFLISRDFLQAAPSTLILGDNIFYGHDMVGLLQKACAQRTGAEIFAHHVIDPQNYGVAEIDSNGNALSIEEKPVRPKSNYAITGIYFYDQTVCDIAKEISPSARGELEISDINRIYMERKELRVTVMGRGFAWLDTGTHDRLLDASSFIATLQKRQGLMIACPEEIALLNKWIRPEDVEVLAAPLRKNAYGEYLLSLIRKDRTL